MKDRWERLLIRWRGRCVHGDCKSGPRWPYPVCPSHIPAWEQEGRREYAAMLAREAQEKFEYDVAVQVEALRRFHGSSKN